MRVPQRQATRQHIGLDFEAQRQSEDGISMKSVTSCLTRQFGQWALLIIAITVGLGMAIYSPTALAQSGAGSIQGTVADSTGAAIVGATVHVVNQATGVATDTKSSSVGFYQAPDLFTGSYSLTITADGFKTYVTRIDLLVGQNAVINPVLSAGEVSQQVVVSGNAVELTTTDSGLVSSTLENARINQLPMNGRDVLTLIQESTPGLSSCVGSPDGGCANGMMNNATDFVADGVTLVGREFGGTFRGTSQMPDPDSIQEVKMDTSGVSAEYGAASVGVITTKSGTNHLHGALFETARNNGLGIAKTRADNASFAAPPLVRNEFGASAGGPIVLPGLYHGKDKSFWFLAYERYSLAQTATQAVTVPTTAMRGGNFSGLINGAGVPQQLYDPDTTAANATCPVPTGGTTNNKWCRQPFTGNQIPMSRLSPTTQALYAITPQPSNSNNPLVQANYADPDPTYNVIPNITFRLDHEFNENNRAYLRFTYLPTTDNVLRNLPTAEPASIAASVNGVNFPAAASGITNEDNDMYASALGFTHTFSPSFFSETVVSQQIWRENNAAGGTPNADFETELGLPNNFGEKGFPEMDDTSSIFSLGGTQYQYAYYSSSWTLDENLTKTIGKHQIQFGGRYKLEKTTFYSNQDEDVIAFGADASALENPATAGADTYAGYSNTGSSLGDQFIGGAASYEVNLEPPNAHYHDMEFDGYVQDNYRLARSLILNLGLRYEAHPAPLILQGLNLGFDFTNDALVTASTPAQLIAGGYTTQAIISNLAVDGGKIETPQEAGLPPNTLMYNHDFNVLPRVGLAWQPFGTKGTVIRGAYGRYLFLPNNYFYIQQQLLHYPYEANYTQSFTLASQSPDGLPNYIIRAPQSTASNWTPSSASTPVMGVNTGSNVVNTGTDTSILPGIAARNVDPRWAPSAATQVNFTIEQPLMGNSVLRVSGIYSHTSNLQLENLYNEHPSNYVYEMQTGVTPPNGGASTIGTNQYSTTATGPYDKTTWSGGSYQDQGTGWSNYDALQVTYQRMYHHGVAWEILWNYGKDLDTGEQETFGEYYPTADFSNSGLSTMTPAYGAVLTPNLGPAEPANLASWQYFKAMNRFENYAQDTYFPKNQIQFNGIVDVPVGSGKWLLTNANRFENELVGGWQIAGDGNIVSEIFAVTATNWGATNPVKTYKHGAPITDCRSGNCYKSFEWFNGYLAPTVLTPGEGGTCTTNCVSGLPGSWAPYETPIDTTPGSTYYGDNEVNITLANGKTSAIAYSPGPSGANPYSKTLLSGPMNWTADASLFKVFPIREQMNLRFNMDAFNVFNVQGYNNPNATDGTECVAAGGVGCTSHNAARQMQLTLRLTF